MTLTVDRCCEQVALREQAKEIVGTEGFDVTKNELQKQLDELR